MKNPRLKKLATFVVRWGIAVFGIYYVLSNLSLSDRVMVRGPDGWPQSLRVDSAAYPPGHHPGENEASYTLLAPDGQARPFPASEVLVKVSAPTVTIDRDGKQGAYEVLAMKVTPNVNRNQWPLVVTPKRNLFQRFFSMHPRPAVTVPPSQITSKYDLGVPYQIVEVGLIPMWNMADKWLLLAAMIVFPLTFLLTAYRWHELLKAIGIDIPSSRTFTLNMVGAFYNTFMPGSTGGDVLKAYYASKQTPHRTRAVMSVVIDRIIGLLALIIVGGVAASTQWQIPACRKIAIVSGLLMLATGLGLAVFYTPILRKLTGINFILARLPMQKQVQNAIQVMEMYRQRPWLVGWSLIVTFPVHSTVVLSAMLAGMAFKLPISPGYYWAVVPVIVLAGAIPISPQGAGVMEFFAILLTRSRGCTISEAFVLTMSIRMVQILWNLSGGLFVLRGGYHAPGDAERDQLQVASKETPEANAGDSPTTGAKGEPGVAAAA